MSGGALLFVADLHRQFEGDFDGFTQFVTDTIAAHTPKVDSRQLVTWIALLESLLGLIDQLRETSTESDEASRAQLEANVQEFANRVTAGRGVSIGSLKNILSAFGFQLGGLPGRTAKDYSSEYTHKAAGLSWRGVAEYTLENDPETRGKFGGRKYDSLTFEEKERLKHRIREGVRSYAKRTGKPFPPRKEAKLLPPSNGGRKTPANSAEQ